MELRTLLAVLLLPLVCDAQGQTRDDPFRNVFRLPPRSRGPATSPSVTGTPTGFRRSSYLNYFYDQQYSVRLVNGNNSREGNVEVLLRSFWGYSNTWESVCDVGWTKRHAKAVCKQLGIPGPAVATTGGRFGFQSNGIGTIVSHCRVGRNGRGLRNCFRRGRITSVGACSEKRIAGVICGKDPSTPYDGKIDVRLRGGGTTGDVEVKYGDQGWGPVCGNGFDIKDATVVCRQLKLGAAKRAYLSGRRASGAFILAGLECTGREKNLGRCRSIRGASVTCQGNRFSGAAVECTGQTDIRLPDLLVDAEELQNNAYLRTEALGQLVCALEEGCLASSAQKIREREPTLWETRTRKLFRFTNKVWNNGKTDYRPKADPSAWKWHNCHEHYHSEESFSEYDLTYEGTDIKAAEGHKASFCLEDSDCRPGTRQKYQCYIEQGTKPPQGIKAGCADIYGYNIDCQWIDVTDIKSGKYVLRVRVNANRKVREVSYDNNQVICKVDLNLERDEVKVTNCRNAPL